eukprot:UN04696
MHKHIVQFIIITPTINIITKYIHGPVKYIYGVLSGFIASEPNARLIARGSINSRNCLCGFYAKIDKVSFSTSSCLRCHSVSLSKIF